MGTGNQTFACPGCAKRFSWSPRFEGKKVACSCGRVFTAGRGFEGARMDGEVYDIASDGGSNQQNRAIAAGAPTDSGPPLIASAPAASRSTSSALNSVASAYPRRKAARPEPGPKPEEQDPEAAHPFINLYLPWLLLALGLCVRVYQAIHFARGSMRAEILLVIVDVHLNALVMLAGAFVSAMVLEVNFGDISRAALKLGAIAVFSDAAASMVAALDQHTIRGIIIGMHLALLLYFGLFYMMFELDLLESLSAVVIIWALQWIVAVGLYSMTSHPA